MKKRILSILLAMAMVFGTLPALGLTAKAAEGVPGEGGESAVHNVIFAVENAVFDGRNTAIAGVDYTATLTANEGYTLPADLHIVIGTIGTTAGTEYTYDSATGELTIFGDKINGEVEICGNATSGSDDTPTAETLSVDLLLKAVDTEGNEIDGLLDAQLNDGPWVATAGHDYATELLVNIGKNTLSNWDWCPDGYAKPTENVIFTVDAAGTVTITSGNASVETKDGMHYIVITLQTDTADDGTADDESTIDVSMQLRYKNSTGEQLTDEYCLALLLGTDQGIDNISPTWINALAAGDYTITFNDAPSGYLVPADATLTVGEEGALSVSGTNVELVKENVTDADETYEVYFVVVTLEEDASGGGSDDDEAANNVCMQLRYKNSTGEQFTDEYCLALLLGTDQGIDNISPTWINALAAGDYTIAFNDAPSGYLVPADVTLTVGEEGALSVSGTNVELVKENVTDADETYEVYFVVVTLEEDTSDGSDDDDATDDGSGGDAGDYIVVYFDNTVAGWGESVYAKQEGMYIHPTSAASNLYEFTVSNGVDLYLTNYMDTMPPEEFSGNYYISEKITPEAGKTYAYVGYDVTIADGSTHGTLTAQTSGFSISKASCGQSVTVVATPATGYELDTLTVKDASGNDVTVNADNTFTMPAQGVTVTAQWKPIGFYIVLRASAAADAETALVWANYGQQLDLSAYDFDPPNEGYILSGWNSKGDGSGLVSCKVGETISEDGVKILFDHAYREEDGFYYFAYLTAQWEKAIFDIEITQPSGGKVETDTDSPVMGDKVTITVDPDPGKRVDEVVVKDKDGNPIKVTKNPDGTYSYEQPVGDVTIEVTFDNISVYSDPTYHPSIEDTTGGDTTVSDKSPEKGDKVTITPDPDKGYDVGKIIVTDSKGDPVKVIDNGDGTYTYVQPAGKVTITVTYVPEEADFVDVNRHDYYFDAVNWAVANDITNGTSAATFGPNVLCTRAQAVTFLWRAAGSPEPKSMVSPFTDVDADSYYCKAVLWAVEQGITNGTGADTFSPNATVTRGQAVTFLWRSRHGFEMEGEHGFHDVHEDAYYHDAVLWAVENGVTNGTSATTFSPDNGCTRGQIVTFLYRSMVE